MRLEISTLEQKYISKTNKYTLAASKVRIEYWSNKLIVLRR